MKPIFDAIYAKFDAANAFKTAIGGRLYPMEVPQNATFPYAVYFMVSEGPDYSFNELFEEALIQISIFTQGDAPGNVCTYAENAKTLFDNCTLTVTGYDFVMMERESARGPIRGTGDVWQYQLDYNVVVRKAR